MGALRNAGGVGILLRDRDGGEVRVGRDGEPVVRYGLSDFDLGHMRTGVDGAAQILEAAGARRIFSSQSKWVVLRPGRRRATARASWPTPTRAAGARARRQLGSFHIMGSARMGGSPNTSACTPGGETWDVRGLYVLRRLGLPDRLGREPDDLDRVDRPHERARDRRGAGLSAGLTAVQVDPDREHVGLHHPDDRGVRLVRHPPLTLARVVVRQRRAPLRSASARPRRTRTRGSALMLRTQAALWPCSATTQSVSPSTPCPPVSGAAARTCGRSSR